MTDIPPNLSSPDSLAAMKSQATLEASVGLNDQMTALRSEIMRSHPDLFTRKYVGRQIVEFPIIKLLAVKRQLPKAEFTTRFRNIEFPKYDSSSTPTSAMNTVNFMPDCWRTFDIAPCDVDEYELYGGGFGEENSDGHLRLFVQRGVVLIENRQTYVADY